MAVEFLNAEVSELCIGKPEQRWISPTTTVSDALTTLKRSGDTHVSIWSCGGGGGSDDSCACVGKISAAEVILFLCREENLGDISKAFEAPVSDIFPKGSPFIRHLESNSSLLEAIDYILEGTQNLVIPLRTANSRKKFLNKPSHHSHEYCWLTQEDIIRFLLNSIGAFSPIPSFSLESLNIIDREIMTVHYNQPLSAALHYFNKCLTKQTSVAVVDEDNRLIGEISPFTLACCDETAAAAIMALSAGEFLGYVNCGGPPEDLVRLVKARLEERKMTEMLEIFDEFFNYTTSNSSSPSCSSDDEFWSSKNGGWLGGGYYPGRRSDAVLCGLKSSLVAVLIQALAYRVSCVWVVDEDHTLIGTVTFAGMLKVFRNVAGGRNN